MLIVDLLPPSARDPQGTHKAIWDEIVERPLELPADKQPGDLLYLLPRRLAGAAVSVGIAGPLGKIGGKKYPVHVPGGHLHQIAFQLGVVDPRIELRRGVLRPCDIDVRIERQGAPVDSTRLGHDLFALAVSRCFLDSPCWVAVTFYGPFAARRAVGGLEQASRFQACLSAGETMIWLTLS